MRDRCNPSSYTEPRTTGVLTYSQSPNDRTCLAEVRETKAESETEQNKSSKDSIISLELLEYMYK